MNPNTFNKITRLLNGESFITKEPGNSMLPLYKSNEEHLLTPITWEQCKVGDVVFCKVKGSWFPRDSWNFRGKTTFIACLSEALSIFNSNFQL